MRSRASLALLEQSAMLLVFALAAALCLRGFLWAGQTADSIKTMDQAVLTAQTAAEELKHSRGQLDWPVYYDQDWSPVPSGGAYCLTVQEEAGSPGLGRATVRVTDLQGTELFSLPVAWQEVIP